MSSRMTVTVDCPRCGKAHPYEVWRSINTVLDPKMRAAVRDLSAFLFTCPSCGERTYVDYGFLYHQMEDRLMVHYADSEKDFEEACAAHAGDMARDMRGDGYLVRVVRTQSELLEKLAIFDRGLDDRAVEVYKVFILASYQRENPGKGAVDTLYCSEGGEDYVQVLDGARPAAVARMPREAYDTVCREYLGALPGVREAGPVIDRQWALETMGLA